MRASVWRQRDWRQSHVTVLCLLAHLVSDWQAKSVSQNVIYLVCTTGHYSSTYKMEWINGNSPLRFLPSLPKVHPLFLLQICIEHTRFCWFNEGFQRFRARSKMREQCALATLRMVLAYPAAVPRGNSSIQHSDWCQQSVSVLFECSIVNGSVAHHLSIVSGGIFQCHDSCRLRDTAAATGSSAILILLSTLFPLRQEQFVSQCTRETHRKGEWVGGDELLCLREVGRESGMREEGSVEMWDGKRNQLLPSGVPCCHASSLSSLFLLSHKSVTRLVV